MKQFLFSLLIGCLLPCGLHAQIGISNTNNTPQATLEVTAVADNTTVADGIIPPRLTRAQLVQKTAYGADQTGAFVYITELSGTTNSATVNVTQTGLYYFDGTLWQFVATAAGAYNAIETNDNTLTSTVKGSSAETALIHSISNTINNNQLITHLNGIATAEVPVVQNNVLSLSDNNATLGVNSMTSSPSALPNLYTQNGNLTDNRTVALGNRSLKFTTSTPSGNGQFAIDGNTLSIQTITHSVGIRTANPIAKLDIRRNAGSSNPGTGYLGLGTTDLSAAEAGAGALRYTTESGGNILYSDGMHWKRPHSNVVKSVVIAQKSSAQNIPQTVDPVWITNWNEITDSNSNFNPTTGEFTAPRTGNYFISFGYNFSSGTINGGTQVEAILFSPLGTPYFKKSVVSYPQTGTAESGAVISFGVRMNAGEIYRPSVWHNTGSTKSLKVGSGSNSGYVFFSVREL